MTKKENLEKEYIKEFEEHFINNKLDINNSQEIKYIKKIITDITKLEMEELGCKLKGEEQNGEKAFFINFINEPNLEYEGRFSEGIDLIPDQIDINIFTIFKDLSSDYKEKRENRCIEIFSTVFHEVQHKRQRMLTRLNICDKYSILYAKEFMLQEIKGEKFYIKRNYNKFAIESNANSVGYGKYYLLMSQINPDILSLLYRGKLYEADLELDKYENGINRSDYFEQLVLEGIDDKFLEKFPILKKEYKSQKGVIKRKNIIELVKDLKDEMATIESMQEIHEHEKKLIKENVKDAYYQIIYRSMKKEMPKDIRKFYKSIRNNSILNLVEFLGTENAKKLCGEIRQSFKEELEEKKLIIENTKRILEKNLSNWNDIEEEMEKNINNAERNLNEEGKEKIDFLTEIIQTIEELSVSQWKKFKITPEDITVSTMDITASEMKFLVEQIKMFKEETKAEGR